MGSDEVRSLMDQGVTSPAVAPSLLRSMNQRFVLDWLYRNGPASRPQISRAIGLSQPTVFATLANLEDVGLVRTRGQSEEQAGRPALIYEVDARAGLVAAVELGQDWVRIAIADLLGTVVARTEAKNTARSVKALVATVERLLASATAEAQVGAISHAVVATWDAAGPAAGQPGASAPPWRRPQLFDELRAALPMAVSVERDVDLAALSEFTLGAGRGADPFVYLHVGAEVGSALVTGGRVYRGANGAAGDIGRLELTTASPVGAPPAGGAVSTLEGALMGADAVSYARALGLSSVTSVGQVIELARRGDETARRAVARQTEVLGNLLTTITAFFDPELIVVGGGIAQHLDMLAVGLAGRLDGDRARPRFVASALGADAIVQGAVVRGVEIAREAVFAERMSVDPGA